MPVHRASPPSTSSRPALSGDQLQSIRLARQAAEERVKLLEGQFNQSRNQEKPGGIASPPKSAAQDKGARAQAPEQAPKQRPPPAYAAHGGAAAPAPAHQLEEELPEQGRVEALGAAAAQDKEPPAQAPGQAPKQRLPWLAHAAHDGAAASTPVHQLKQEGPGGVVSEEKPAEVKSAAKEGPGGVVSEEKPAEVKSAAKEGPGGVASEEKPAEVKSAAKEGPGGVVSEEKPAEVKPAAKELSEQARVEASEAVDAQEVQQKDKKPPAQQASEQRLPLAYSANDGAPAQQLKEEKTAAEEDHSVSPQASGPEAQKRREKDLANLVEGLRRQIEETNRRRDVEKRALQAKLEAFQNLETELLDQQPKLLTRATSEEADRLQWELDDESRDRIENERALERLKGVTHSLPKPSGRQPSRRPSLASNVAEQQPAVQGKVPDLNVSAELARQRQRDGTWRSIFRPQVFRRADLRMAVLFQLTAAGQGTGIRGRRMGAVNKAKFLLVASRMQKLARMNAKLGEIVKEMRRRLVDRDEAARLLVLSTLAAQNILLFGPPGTAKSAVSRLLSKFIYDCAEDKGGSYFEAQFHPSTTVEDIFGPMSLKDLEQGRLKRNVTPMLPYASLAFLDEAFKAQASLLSCLLSTLNERCFKNGDQMLKELPLVTAIVASNEVPQDAGAGALVDRLLIRVFVDYVSGQDEPDPDGTNVPYNAQNNVMNSKFMEHDKVIEPLLTLADFQAFRSLTRKLIPHPADKLSRHKHTLPADTRQGSEKPAAELLVGGQRVRSDRWVRRLERELVLFKKEEAEKLCNEGFLKEVADGVIVAKAACVPTDGDEDLDKSADFTYQPLEENWRLHEFKTLAEFKRQLIGGEQDASGKASGPKVTYPHILTFATEEEPVKPYDLVMEFVKEVRRIDAAEEARNESRKLSVEGGGRLSDRRLKQIVDLLGIVAVSNMRVTLTVPDLFVMAYCCWKTKKDWVEISTFWLHRLCQEMRGMKKEYLPYHDPKDHLWLSEKVKKALHDASKGQNLQMSQETKEQHIRRVVNSSEVVHRKREKARLQKKLIADRQHQMKLNEEDQKHQASIMEQKRLIEQQQQETRQMSERHRRMEAMQEINRKKAQAEEEELEIQRQAIEDAQRAMEAQGEMERQKADQMRRLEEETKKLRQERDKGKKVKEVVRENTVKLWDIVKKEDVDSTDIEESKTLIIGGAEHGGAPADVNMSVTAEVATPFTEAIRRGHKEILGAMAGAVPPPNLQLRDHSLSPPLAMAIKYHKDPMAASLVTLLLGIDCNPADKDKDGNTALHLAVVYGRTDSMQALKGSQKTLPCFNVENEAGQKPEDLEEMKSKNTLFAQFSNLSNYFNRRVKPRD